MRKFAVILLCVIFLFAMFGCASVKKASTFNGLKLCQGKENVGHYHGKNWGIYVLWIPILTGDSDKVEADGGALINTTLLKDTVNLDSLAAMITRIAKADGADTVVDMVSSRNTVWVAPFLVVFMKNVSMSANGVK